MNIHKINGNTYITSDEEIKEGMWFLPISGIGWELNIPIKADGNGGYHNEHCKKIILTTDQDLINDGVAKLPQQEISDEEIENEAKVWASEDLIISIHSFVSGAKWYREQIKQPKKD
jgi:hypothetical protein